MPAHLKFPRQTSEEHFYPFVHREYHCGLRGRRLPFLLLPQRMQQPPREQSRLREEQQPSHLPHHRETWPALRERRSDEEGKVPRARARRELGNPSSSLVLLAAAGVL